MGSGWGAAFGGSMAMRAVINGSEAARPIESERIASGIFKVTPKEDLVDGEYGFCQAGAAPASGTGGKIFGFGSNAK